jgi:hypothetical protein
MFVRFSLDSASHTMKFTGAYPKNSPYPGAYFLMKIGTAYRSERTATRIEILESAKHLAEFMEQDREFFPYRYSTEEHMLGRDDLLVKGSGTATGFQIDGKMYSITGGVGECYLEEMIPQPNGKWKLGKRIDVRDKKRIVTENWGDIKISKKKVTFTFPDELARVIGFLEDAMDRNVKIYAYDSPSFKELLMEAAQGMGSDDGAIEMLLQRGEKCKRQLIAALKQKQFKAYRHIVVRFLLSLYPEESTHQTIKQFINEIPNDEEKRSYLTLLAAFFDEKDSG